MPSHGLGSCEHPKILRGSRGKVDQKTLKRVTSKHSPLSAHCSPQLPLLPLHMGTGQNQPLERAHRIFLKILRLPIQESGWSKACGQGQLDHEVGPRWVTGTLWGYQASASLFSDPFLGRKWQEQGPVNTGDGLAVGAQGLISKRGMLRGQTLYAQPTWAQVMALSLIAQCELMQALPSPSLRVPSTVAGAGFPQGVGRCQPLTRTCPFLQETSSWLKAFTSSHPDEPSTLPLKYPKPRSLSHWPGSPLGESLPPATLPDLGAPGGLAPPASLLLPQTLPWCPLPCPVRAELVGAVGNYRLSNMLKSVQLCLQCSRCLHCLTQK